MDVRCERCQTEYVIDDARVAEGGLQVQCQQCQHVFRVFREAAGAELSWMLRGGSGEIVRFRDLPMLQQLIRSGRARRSDEISRSGEAWKRLGDIPELAPLFEQVEQTLPADRPRRTTPPPPPGRVTPGPMSTGRQTPPPPPGRVTPAPPAGPGRATPPPQGRVTPAPPGRVTPAPGRVGSAATPAPRRAELPMPTEVSGPFSLGELGGAPVDEPRFTGVLPAVGGDRDRRTTARVAPSPRLDEVPVLRPRKSFTGAAILLASVAAAGVLGAVAYRGKIMALIGGGKAPRDASIDKALAAMARDTDEGFTEAEPVLERAAAQHGDAPAALAALAELYARWADALSIEARLYEEKAKRGPGDAATRADDRRKQAIRRLSDAKLSAALAYGRAPESAEVARAYGLYLALSDAPAADVSKALARGHVAEPDVAFIEAVHRRRQGDLPRAFERARASGSGAHARLLLAMLAHETGKDAEAKALAERLVAEDPQNDRAKLLLSLLAPPVVAAPRDAAAEEKLKEPKEPPADLGPEQLVAQGNKLLENGRGAQARKLFERALEKRPGYPAALSGLGITMYEARQYASALNALRKAKDAGDREAAFYIGECYKAQGESERALAAYKAYVEGGGRENLAIAKTAIKTLEREAAPEKKPPPKREPEPGEPKPEAHLPPPDPAPSE